MRIEVLGTGCPGCKKLEENVRAAARELGLDAEISKTTDLGRIAGYGVMGLPALVVDGNVILSGRIPPVSELKALLR